MFNIAVILESTGKYTAAIKWLKRLLAKDSTFLEAHIGLCYNLLRIGKNDEALQAIDKAYKICIGKHKLDSINLRFDRQKSPLIRKMELQKLEKV